MKSIFCCACTEADASSAAAAAARTSDGLMFMLCAPFTRKKFAGSDLVCRLLLEKKKKFAGYDLVDVPRSTRWSPFTGAGSPASIALLRPVANPEFPYGPCSFHAEQAVDAARVDPEGLRRLHVERARMRQVDVEVVGHAGRSGGEHHHARAEEHRFRNAVRHEQDCLAGLLPDA